MGVVVPLEGMPLVVPLGMPLLGGGPQGLQTPLVDPSGTEHVVPGQQSALVVHPPHALTQAAV
jgi:hypothetical protein